MAIIFGFQKLIHYLQNNKTKLIFRINPLKYLLSKPKIIGRMANYIILLRYFDIEYANQKVVKEQVLVDQLAEAPFPRTKTLSLGLLDASMMYLKETIT